MYVSEQLDVFSQNEHVQVTKFISRNESFSSNPEDPLVLLSFTTSTLKWITSPLTYTAIHWFCSFLYFM